MKLNKFTCLTSFRLSGVLFHFGLGKWCSTGLRKQTPSTHKSWYLVRQELWEGRISLVWFLLASSIWDLLLLSGSTGLCFPICSCVMIPIWGGHGESRSERLRVALSGTCALGFCELYSKEKQRLWDLWADSPTESPSLKFPWLNGWDPFSALTNVILCISYSHLSVGLGISPSGSRDRTFRQSHFSSLPVLSLSQRNPHVPLPLGGAALSQQSYRPCPFLSVSGEAQTATAALTFLRCKLNTVLCASRHQQTEFQHRMHGWLSIYLLPCSLSWCRYPRLLCGSTRSSLRCGNIPINTKTDSNTIASDSVNIIPPVNMLVKMGKSQV